MRATLTRCFGQYLYPIRLHWDNCGDNGYDAFPYKAVGAHEVEEVAIQLIETAVLKDCIMHAVVNNVEVVQHNGYTHQKIAGKNNIHELAPYNSTIAQQKKYKKGTGMP